MLKTTRNKIALPAVFCFILVGPHIELVNAQTTVKYTYDELGRLIVVEDPVNGNRNYQLDKAGNRSTVSVGSASSAPSYLPAPTGLFCNNIAQGAWKASWNPVPGAAYYQYRSNEERTYTVTTTYQVTSYTCKWVAACDANGVCGYSANF